MLIALLRAHIDRQILLSLHNLFTQIRQKVRSFIPFSPMSNSTDLHQQSSTVDSTPFDPSEPSIPISYPIKTLEELHSRAYFDSFHYPFNKSSVPLQSTNLSLPNRPRLLVCHDMQGGYGDDKWVQGGSNPSSYSIWHWYLIDVFVYFSHSLVSLPPPCWINAAHRHGVKVLGTFLAEWEEGRQMCCKLLETEESARIYAARLAELAVALGFDGWLINMEINLDFDQISKLKEFVSHLTDLMHFHLPGSLVIWYDAITIHGKLDWQDQLNENNKPFFDLCDGIFVNYTWKSHYPEQSASVAGDRNFDVYVGIDVFGRNTFGGGQWNISVALEVLKNNDVSAAIFAPGWVYDTNQPPDFQTAQNSWWNLVEKSWGIMNKYPKTLPFYSNFDQGHGYHISAEGRTLIEAPWNNLSCQEFQPCLEFNDPTSVPIQVLFDAKEDSYSGGGNITFRGFLEDDAYFTRRLFCSELVLGRQPLHLTYSVKSEGDSILGLSLHFSSSKNERTSVLIASNGTKPPSKEFNKVITAHQISEPEKGSGWNVHKGSFVVNEEHILTEIQAVCYRLQPEHNESGLKYSPAKYFAVLGHIEIKNSVENLYLPQSSAWLVEGHNIKFGSENLGSKTVSVKIVWKLKSGNECFFPKYNIYVEKQREGCAKGACEFLGVVKVTAYYVSDLSVPSDTGGLKFIVQVFDVNGACQKLDDSPFFQLAIEGTVS